MSDTKRGEERSKERMMSRCFIWFPIGSLGEPNIYHDSGVFYKNRDFTWRVSDCEELVRGLVTRNNGVKFIVGIAAYSIADCIS